MESVADEPTQSVETAPSGLTASAVAERVAAGLTNASGDHTSRTLAEIVRANVFTRFNAILGTMFVLIVITGEFADALFGIVLVANALIGIGQEWLAKRKLDQLAVLSAPRAHAVRDGVVVDLPVDDVVLDDLLELRVGDQVCADGRVVTVEGLEVDESLLTGESDPIVKTAGDQVLSGSIVVAGTGRFQATAVGHASYARRLAAEARQFSLVASELQAGTNQILKYVTWALLPCSALLLWSQLTHDHRDSVLDALPRVVAGVVAMVPEGLVLLTSLAFLIAARSLARRSVLVQELPAVEGLARVDVVCVDKTGTITEGTISFHRLELLGTTTPEQAAAVLGAIADDEHANATALALGDAFVAPGWRRVDAVPFSSARKWSAVEFAEHGTWFIGAPEMLWAERPDPDGLLAQASTAAATGRRVLLLASGLGPLTGEELPPVLDAAAFVEFEETVRADAPETFRYFAEQGVALRVISGDNPATVGAVAARAGIPDADRVFDARLLPDDPDEVAAVLDEHTVFGRVTPHQKRAMVQALQRRGHVVAMTGDGVNDALALKDADIGVAMGNGAAATRAVAQLVLLDGKFSRMPGVVAEGRRVIANVERVSNLYVTKTVYAFWFALLVGLTASQYPFLPRHMTIVSTFTIGLPSFALALAPNSKRYVPGFVGRVLRFTIPNGTIVALATLVSYAVAKQSSGVDSAQASAVAVSTLFVLGLWVLVVLARPLVGWKYVLVGAMGAAFVAIYCIPGLRRFYAVPITSSTTAWLVAGACAAVGVVAIEAATRWSRSISS